MPRRIDWNGVGERRCSKCGVMKPLSGFSKSYKRIGDPAPRSICKSCSSQSNALLYQREAKRNREKYGYAAGPSEVRLEQNRKMREKNVRLKREVISHYGGTCACCGESDIDVLSIDHINNNGSGERRLFGVGATFYRHLRSVNYTQGDYRVLCCNCNFALGWYGYCPHQAGSQYELLATTAPSKHKRYQHRLRLRTFHAYGGSCMLCGNSVPEFLNIHHVNGGGREERRKLGFTTDSLGFYRYLARIEYPSDRYQLLCSNCNRKQMVDATRVGGGK